MSEIFEKLEQAKAKFQVGEFSISDTTLEGVFIHFIKGNRQLETIEQEQEKEKEKEKENAKGK